jgi:hypothetical protein
MSNLVTFEQFDETIRQTPDGRFSVYDVIRFCGKKGHKVVWQRLTAQYPEVVTKCYHFKFPGPGQRETPVADREGILYIIGLLPGVVGRSYRESALLEYEINLLTSFNLFNIKRNIRLPFPS